MANIDALEAMEDPELQAFALVGMFLHHWSLLESTINKTITKALGLNVLQGIILHANIQFRDKIHILRTLVSLQAIKDNQGADALLNSIADQSFKRNMIAHDLFVPTDEGNVEFIVYKAKGKLKFPDTIWTTRDFVRECLQMDQYAKEVDALRTELAKVVDLNTLLKDLSAFSPSTQPQQPTIGLGALAALAGQLQQTQDSPGSDPPKTGLESKNPPFPEE